MLDLGCGPGVLGRLVIDEKPSAQYYGVDGDPLMLGQCGIRTRETCPCRALDLRKTGWSRKLVGQLIL